MKNIEKRVYEEAIFMCDNHSTIREVAKKFKVSKSTVHYDLVIRLQTIDNQLYTQVKTILNYNTSIRHIRGGEATKNKYLKK